MNKMPKNPLDKDFLLPLQNRPGLEPNQRFRENLRNTLTSSHHNHKRKFDQFENWKVLVSMGLAFVIIGILTVTSILETVKNTAEVRKTPVQVSPGAKGFEGLLEKRPEYKKIYSAISAGTGFRDESKAVIYYLEGLRRQNRTELEKLVQAKDMDITISALISSAKHTDFESFKLSQLTHNSKWPVYGLYFSYKQKDSSEERSKGIFLNVENPQEPKVFDPLDSGYILEPGNTHVKEAVIQEEVKRLTGAMKLGISQKEATRSFGNNTVNIKEIQSEDGSAEEWRYDYLKSEEQYPSNVKDGEVDIENLQKQLTGIQLFIGWSKEGIVHRISMFYGMGGKVYSKILTDSGLIEDEVILPGQGGASPGNVQFKLSFEEQQLYDKFRKNHNQELLRNLSPKTVAKLYVQAMADIDSDTVYELYTKQKDRVRWTKDQNDITGTDPKVYMKNMGNITSGVFIETGTDQGYIQFQNQNGLQGFQMVKDDGIWKVSFTPIQ